MTITEALRTLGVRPDDLQRATESLAYPYSMWARSLHTYDQNGGAGFLCKHVPSADAYAAACTVALSYGLDLSLQNRCSVALIRFE